MLETVPVSGLHDAMALLSVSQQEENNTYYVVNASIKYSIQGMLILELRKKYYKKSPQITTNQIFN
ncbi:hypothetical protein GCM10028807_48140 [Spirosoma daeguense]